MESLLTETEYKQYISNIIDHIHSPCLLSLIYRFARSLYIHS